MGVWGWKELADPIFVEGTVDHIHPEVHTDDGDWAFQVRPTDAHLGALVNPALGKPNTNGFIECEVEPPDVIGGESAEDDDVYHRYMDRIVGRPVRVVGTWAIDLSHSYQDESCVFGGCPGEGKTEIHPILSLLVHMPPPPGAQKQVELFVFTDSSGETLANVPHAHESRVAHFRVPIGSADPLQDPRASFAIRSETDMAANKAFAITESNGMLVFEGTVVSGTEATGTGFYHATVDLFYESSRRTNPVPWLEPLLLT